MGDFKFQLNGSSGIEYGQSKKMAHLKMSISLIPGIQKHFTGRKGNRVMHQIKCDIGVGKINGALCLQHNHQTTRGLRSGTGG